MRPPFDGLGLTRLTTDMSSGAGELGLEAGRPLKCRSKIQRSFLNDARFKIRHPPSPLYSSEDWAKPRVDGNVGNSVTLIALTLDPAIFDRSTCAADLLHLFRELSLLRLLIPTNPVITVTVFPPRCAVCRMISTRPYGIEKNPVAFVSR